MTNWMCVIDILAICFLEFWKRKQLYLQQIWNVEDFETDEVSCILRELTMYFSHEN